MSIQDVVSITLMGGLGNQLFQIFTCIAYGISTNRRIILPYSDVLTTGTIRPTYWDSIFKTIKYLTTFNETLYTPNIISKFDCFREFGFRYNKIPTLQTSQLRLFGYFQSPHYFQEHFDTISLMMNLPNQIVSIRNKYSSYFPANTRTISMHFRLGDYKTIQDYHPLMPVQYYISAMQHILSKNNTTCNVLYFCEEPDLNDVSDMIQKIKSVIQNVNFVRANNSISDWEQLLLMASCHDNIVANSTFSWWGAYLNQTSDKIVCYPNIWFGPRAGHDVSDLFPDTWNRITW
jgi:hypothetical protein